MKILIVNRFFGGAQIPTGRMAEDVARVLVERGHEVTALASSGEYVGAARRADGIRHTTEGIRLEMVRVAEWMPRVLAWVWFTWQARKRIPRMDWDVCVLMTDPPLLPLLARRIRRKAYGIRHIAVWVMDLYPEALAASGRITKSNPIYRWYFNKRQRALAACDLLICLGEAQKALVGAGRIQHTAYSIEQTRIAVVPPWDDRGNIALATQDSLRNLALYAGNLGEAHCFEEILAAVPHLPGDWTIRFAARGAKLRALKEKESQSGRRLTRIDTDGVRAAAPTGLGGSAHTKVTLGPRNVSSDRKIAEAQEGAASLLVSSSFGLLSSLGAKVEITGYASEEETPKLLASARVHLITMSPGWEGIVVPSKLYGCVRTGRPVLFIGPENADTAREIHANDWGKVLPPGASGQEVASAILELAARPTRAVQSENGAEKVAELIQGLATD